MDRCCWQDIPQHAPDLVDRKHTRMRYCSPPDDDIAIPSQGRPKILTSFQPHASQCCLGKAEMLIQVTQGLNGKPRCLTSDKPHLCCGKHNRIWWQMCASGSTESSILSRYQRVKDAGREANVDSGVLKLINERLNRCSRALLKLPLRERAVQNFIGNITFDNIFIPHHDATFAREPEKDFYARCAP